MGIVVVYSETRVKRRRRRVNGLSLSLYLTFSCASLLVHSDDEVGGKLFFFFFFLICFPAWPPKENKIVKDPLKTHNCDVHGCVCVRLRLREREL